MYGHVPKARIYKGQTIKIEPNTIVSIPMIVHGSVSHEENNAYCRGAKFTIEGKQRNNMLSFQTIRLSMVELSIQVGNQEVQELRDMTILSPSCVTQMKCIVSIGIPTHSILTHWNKRVL